MGANAGAAAVMRLFRRACACLRRGRLEDDLRDEVHHHLELRRLRLIEDGLHPGAAAAEARRLFGNELLIREQARELWSVRFLDSLRQDLRYGVRVLRRSPASTAAAVLSLAVGIGAATSVFTVADAALFRPLAVTAPEELRQLRATLSLGAGRKVMGGVDAATFREMAAGTRAGLIVAMRTVESVTFTAARGRQGSLRAEIVSPNYFEVLGIRAAAGRLPYAGEPPQHAAVVISERFWRTALGSDPGVLGLTMTLNGAPLTVTGVTRNFRGVVADRPADVFVPLDSARLVEPSGEPPPLRVLVRVPPDVHLPVAEERLRALYIGAAPSLARGSELEVELLPAAGGIADAREHLEQPLRIALLFGVALLFVACANTGGLLLARFASRRAEFAVRVAIGAGRGRLARQLVIEALLIAALAASAGLAAASFLGPALLRAIPIDSAAPDFELRLDWRVLAFTGGAGLLAALIAAGISLWRTLRVHEASTLDVGGGRSIVRSRRRLTHGLIAAQVALSLLLLAAAGAMTRSLVNLRQVDPGYDASQAFLVTVDAGARAGPDALTAYFRRLAERIEAAPHVARASLVQFPLLTPAATTGTVDVAGFSPAHDDDRWVRVFFVGAGFVETAGMRLLAGRDIQPVDRAGAEPVAVVNETLARFYFGRPELALGRIINADVRVVGIVADARYNTLRDAPVRAMFVPFEQARPRPSMTFVVRPMGEQQAALNAVAEAVRVYDPGLRFRIATMEQQIAASLTRERFVASLAAVLSALALFLSCTALYGAVAYAVAERRGELAVRLALGASRRDILRLVLVDPVRTAVAGILLGLPAAYLVLRSLSAMLFGVEPFDLPTLLASAGWLLLVTVLAAVRPARRAAAVDPLECLRQ